MKYLTIFFVSSIYFFGCKENEIIFNAPQNSNTSFGINTTVITDLSNSSTEKKVYITYSTDDLSEVPLFKVENTAPSYWTVQNTLTSSTLNLPYSDSLFFEIKKSGQSAIGKIQFPAEVVNLKCNNKILNPYPISSVNNLDTIPLTNNYLFEWECAKYDSFYVELIDNFSSQRISFYTKDKHYTFSSLQNNLQTLRITSVIGSEFAKSNIPNFKCEIGEGYVFSNRKNEYLFTVK